MDGSIWLNLLVPVLISAVVASRGFHVDEEYVERWASSAGLRLADETRPIARRFLLWSRRSRTVGGLVGFLAPLVYAQVAKAITGREIMTEQEAGGSSTVLMFLGYLLGALVAELAINRPSGAVRNERRLRDYLPTYLLAPQRGLGALIAVLTAVHALIPLEPRFASDRPAVVTFGLIGVAVAIAIELLERAIISRRQSAEVELLGVDDAMRSTSTHLLAGAGIAILLFFTAGLGATLIGVASTTTPAGLALILILFPLSLAVWLDAGKPHGFRVTKGANA